MKNIFLKWYNKDPNDPPTFSGVLAVSNKSLFWFAVLSLVFLALKMGQLANL
jgi:hypothetical protein